jgi:predicted Zn-dependent protease
VRGAALATTLLLLAACAGPGGLAGAGSGPASATRAALDGWLGGQPGAAPVQLEALAAVRPEDPWARLGAALQAERALRPERAVPHLVALLETSPGHPLALVALRALARLAVDAPDQAEAIGVALAGLRPRQPLTGLAAYRLRVARIAVAEGRGELAQVAALRAENGVVTAWSVAGPFGDFATLELDRPFPPEQGALPASVDGPLLAPARPTRPLEAPLGELQLDAEPFDGAFHYLAADLEVLEGGAHLAMVRAGGSWRAWLDGAPLAERRGWSGTAPQQHFVAVALSPGPHQLLVKLGRDAGPASLLLGFSRVDGRPARLLARARPPGPLLPARAGPVPPLAWRPEALAAALAPGGAATARLLAALDALNDLETAKGLVDEGLRLAPRSPPLLVLRGRLLQADGSLDEQVRRGRAEDSLRRALELDPGDGPARLELARLLTGMDRPADAEALLGQAPALLAERGPALLARAQVALARGQGEAAGALLERAVAGGSRCAAAPLRLTQAAQREEVGREDALALEGRGCPGGSDRLALLRLRRGDPAGALELLEPLLRWRPADPVLALRVVAARRAAGDRGGAAAALQGLRASWPRDPWLARELADLRELDGDRGGARAAREEALRLDPADLATRRLLALEDGREALDDLAVDGEAALRRYRAAAVQETGSAVLVLDAAAVEVHPGGAMTERVHQLFRVLDQRAVDRYGEVVPPDGAQLLRLRTLKADGRVIEPELGDGKGSHSLAALEPGDLFELEYLRSERAPRPVPPLGTSPFYLAEAGERVFASSYVVSAPRGLGLQADSHRLDPPAQVVVEGDREVLRVGLREVEALRLEPLSPPPQELLPFVEAGVADGSEPVQARRASELAGLLRSTVELRAVAAEVRARCGAGATPEGLARCAWEETRLRLPGQPDGQLAPASVILSRGRGHRLVLMAALLDALGVASHLALVNPFEASQERYRFGREEAWPVLLLEVTVPGGPAWLAGTARQLPFGALPERLRGREALVLPRPGEAPRRARTPLDNPVAEGRELELTARLDADGAAALEGTERLLGATGAEIKDAFARLDRSRLQAVVESLYAGALTGLTLTEVALDGVDSPEATLTIRWRGRLPGPGRAAGEALTLDRVGMPVQLGRRLATLPVRAQPLVLPEAIAQTVRVRLLPPAGLAATPGPALELATPFGSYRRREWSDAGALCWEERVLVPLARVAPADYPAFAAFAAAVDAAQAGGLTLSVAPGPAQPGVEAASKP